MKILYCEPTQYTSTDMGQPVVSLLTDSSLSRNRLPLFLPPHHDRWELTLAPAIRISRLGKFVAPRFAHRYYDAWTFTARLRPDGLRLPASATDTSFDSSMVVGDWLPLEQLGDTVKLGGSVEEAIAVNHEEIDSTLAKLSGYFMIKHGDIIVPPSVSIALSPVPDTRIEIAVSDIPCLSFKIK